MKLTNFEREILKVKGTKENPDFNSLVVFYFHQLLVKIKNENVRNWTHDLLRNYVNVFYLLSKQIEFNMRRSFNYYDDPDNPDLYVFFTGLYTEKSLHGFNNGLYFVRSKDGVSVLSKEDLMKRPDGPKILKEITHRESFENELTLEQGLQVKDILVPDVISSKDAQPYVVMDKQNNHWLHILIDGIDNLPTAFVQSFFNLDFENFIPDKRKEYRRKKIKEMIMADNGSFEYFQKIMREAISRQQAKQVDLPIIYYVKGCRYNHLLPIYLQNLDKPDFCIVLAQTDKDKNVWEPVTSLNMDEAYCDIRVFGKSAVDNVAHWW